MEKRGDHCILSRFRSSSARRAQTGVEFIVLMSFVLIVLLAIIALNQGLLDSLTGQMRAERGRIMVNDLADAAESVYFQGVGAQTRVLISVPAGVRFSQVSNHTIRLGLDDRSGQQNDIYRNTNFIVNGFIPKEEGNHWVVVRAMPGYVLIGYSLVYATPSGITFTLYPGNSSNATLTISNVIGRPVSLLISYSMDPEVDLDFNQTTLYIDSNLTMAVLASVSVPNPTEAGIYTGVLTMAANTTTESQMIYLPITVVVLGGVCESVGVCSSIQLYPDIWDLGNITRNHLFPNIFYLCNNNVIPQDVQLSFTNQDYMGFDPGILAKTRSVLLSGKNCTTFSVYVNTTSPVLGPYSTILSAQAANGSDASTILFNIVNITQTIPVVNLISPADNTTIYTRYASLRYNVTSNSSISYCSLLINNRVNATSYNVPRNVANEFNITNFQAGWYNWTVSCMDATDGVGTAYPRRLRIKIMSLYAVPERMWEEDFDPTWITEIQHADDGSYATIIDELPMMPDWTEYDFPSLGINNTNSIKTATFTFMHLEDLAEGFFDEVSRYKIECYNGNSWIYIGPWNWTNITGGVYGNLWAIWSSPNLKSCLTSPDVANDLHVRIYYDPAFGTGGIEYVDWAQIEYNLSEEYYPNLWPRAIDRYSPVDFSSGLNTTSNTFGRNAGDDGWDWTRNNYGGSVNAASFNTDPNMDGNLADSTVAADDQIEIILGAGTPGAPNSPTDASYTGPISSGAYGVQFNITPELYSLISSGAHAYVSFDWEADADGGGIYELDAEDEAWIKSRFTTPSQTVWLGSNLDAGDNDRDNNNEIWWANNPSTTLGYANIDVTSYITSVGVYYLDLGGMIGGWSGEAFGAYFDNVMVSVVQN